MKIIFAIAVVAFVSGCASARDNTTYAKNCSDKLYEYDLCG